MKKANKLLALVLAAALCLGLSLPAMAANSLGVTFTAQLDHATLNISDQDQTVTMTVTTNKDVDVISLQGVITHDAALTLTSISNETLGFIPANVNLGEKMFAWYDLGVQTHTISTIVTATFTVPANTPAGTYSVGLKDLNCVKVTGTNYGDTWEDAGTASATLTLVDPSHREPQTITAADVDMTYGDTDKKINATAFGEITYAVKAGSEDIIDVAADGKLTAKNVGEAYVIVTAAGDNTYASATKEVKVTVSAKAITPAVTVSAGKLAYTGKAQTPSVTVKDGSVTLTEGVDYTLSYSDNQNAGQATITITAKAGGRYTFAAVTENFTIDKAVITITAEDKSAHVGDAAPALTYTVSGLVNGETLAVEPTVAYAAEPDMTKTGTVEILVSGAQAPAGDNYTINYVKGLLTIVDKSAPLPITGSKANTITIGSAENGKVSSDRASAVAGTKVTITVTPDSGFALGEVSVVDANGKALDLVSLGNGKYTFTMPAGAVTVKASFAPVAGNCPFTDVKVGDYYYDAVLWAVDKGITTGVSATRFDPNGSCTRAQAVTFLWRAMGSPAPTGASMSFTDVAADSYYYNAVLWAVENGVTTGTSATTFSPDAPCDRGQIVTFLHRAMKSPAASAQSTFSDVAADAYYAQAVAWAVENGVTTGTGDNAFSPAASCSRSQIVTFLYRAMNK